MPHSEESLQYLDDALSQMSDLGSEISQNRKDFQQGGSPTIAIRSKASKEARLVAESEQLGRRLAAEIQRLRAELLQSREQSAALATSLRQSHLDSEALKQRVETIEQAKEALQCRLHDSAAQIEELRLEKTFLETRLNNATRDSEERINHLSKDLNVMINQRDAARDESERIHTALRDLRNKHEQQIEHLTGQHEAAMAEKERCISDLQHQINLTDAQHNRELEALQHSLDTEKAARMQETSLLREQLAEQSRLQRDKLAAAALHGDQSSVIHELQLEIMTLRQESSRTKQSEVRKDQENFQLQQRISILEGQRAHLHQQNKRLEDAVATLEDRQATLSQEIYQLTSDRRNNKHSSCVTRLRELQERCNIVEQALAEAQQRNTEAAHEIEKYKSKHIVLRKKYDTLKQYNRQLLATTNWYEATLQKYDAAPPLL